MKVKWKNYHIITWMEFNEKYVCVSNRNFLMSEMEDGRVFPLRKFAKL